MEVNEVQRVRSTPSHTPDRLQVLLIMVVVLGHWRVWVVPTSVAGQNKSPVVSASHLHAAHVHVYVCVMKERGKSLKQVRGREGQKSSSHNKNIFQYISRLLSSYINIAIFNLEQTIVSQTVHMHVSEAFLNCRAH